MAQDGAYVIYLHTRQVQRRAFCYRHTLSLVKQGQKITFFCPLNGFLSVESSSVDSSYDARACFLEWLKNEIHPASMEYFVTPHFYAEAARIPLPASPGAMVLHQTPLCSHLPCVKLAYYKCAKCKQVSYCGPECQKIHWKSHKPHCCA